MCAPVTKEQCLYQQQNKGIIRSEIDGLMVTNTIKSPADPVTPNMDWIRSKLFLFQYVTYRLKPGFVPDPVIKIRIAFKQSSDKSIGRAQANLCVRSVEISASPDGAENSCPNFRAATVRVLQQCFETAN